MKRASRKPSKLSDSLHQRLNSYALAASAAGVSLLALAQPAQAKIVYTPAHVSLKQFDHVPLDLNGDGTADFQFYVSLQIHGSVSNSTLFILPSYKANAVWGTSLERGLGNASALRPNVRVGPNKRFEPSNEVMEQRIHSTRGSSSLGRWKNVKNRYLGLQFYVGGKIHYGWARLNVRTIKEKGIHATLTGYAYETIPNKPIITGKTKGPDVITVEPASLGHLARGASGLAAWAVTAR